MNNIQPDLYNSYLEVDHKTIRRNAEQLVRSLPKGTELIPVLKCDAYGLGAAPVAKTLADAVNIRIIAVSHVSEGIALRREGIRQKLLVMGGTLPEQFPAALEAELTLTVCRPGFVSELAHACRRCGRKAEVHIKIETGMNRIGLQPGDELSASIEELHSAQDVITVMGAFSHFSEPENIAVSDRQNQKLLAGISQLEAGGITVPLRHIAASAASEFFPQFNLDAVRIGRRLCWDNPCRPLGDIREVCSWRTKIMHIHRLSAGETLGYGGVFHLEKDTVVAVLGIGYGDGLNEALCACHAPVLIGGKRCPLLRCCMDQTFADVTGLNVSPGDEATLFGYDKNGVFLSAQEIAALIGDGEGCGLTAALSSRVARIHK